MKKLFLLLTFLLFSCQKTSKTNVTNIDENLSYFKDNKTNLCFASISSTTSNNWKIISITYVPCDSLTKYNILK